MLHYSKMLLTHDFPVYSLDSTRTRRGGDFIDELTEANLPSLNFLQTNDANTTVEGQYHCAAFSQAGGTENCVTVLVLGKIK